MARELKNTDWWFDMKNSTYINNQKSIEWGLIVNQAALLDYLIGIHRRIAATYQHWEKIGVISMSIDYQSICDDLPLFYKKPNTVYKALKTLIDKGLIIHHRLSIQNRIECISVSSKGLTFLGVEHE